MAVPPTRAWSNPDLAAFIERRLLRGGTRASAPRATPDAMPERRAAYRQAAAVLVSFNPATLRPVGPPVIAADAYRCLVDDVTAGAAEGGVARWTLKPAIRHAALATLQRGVGFAVALAANPDRPGSDLQRCFEHYLVGAAYPAVGDRSAGQLAQTLRIIDWLSGLVPGLPSQRDLERRLERARFLAPFTNLLAKGFAGRERELDTLRNYVGVQQATTIIGQSLRYIDRWASTITGNPWRGPLVVWGPGGVGKSTLIARFVSEHTAQHELTPFPFAYLDFDSGSIGVGSPAPLLIQTCVQLEAQFPQLAGPLSALRRRVDRLLARPAPGTGSGEIAITRERPGRSERFEQACLRRLGALAQQAVDDVSLKGRVMPFLVVLDTFEDVHHASEAQVRKISGYIDTLREHVRSLRVVVSGRNDVRPLLDGAEGVEGLELTDLDSSAAHAVLQKLGIDADDERAYIYGLTGGNPLSLHLAAELSLTGSLDRGIAARVKYGAARLVGEALVQGMLYDRILFNIDDEDVKKLAHPGLALRYLTADIIDRVLAGPCRLDLPGTGPARDTEVQRLFEALQRHASLVVPDGAGLRHRGDVRRAMLTSLDLDKPALVRAIDRAAVAYHQTFEAANPRVARAEEVYHRLRLNQGRTEIDARWVPGIGNLLADSLGDLSVQSQLYLVDRGVRADLEGVSRVSLGDPEWEQFTAAKVVDLVRYGLLTEAAAALAERPVRSLDTPLFLAEAQLASAQREWARSRARAEDAQRAATRTNDPRRLETALLVAAVAAIKQGDAADGLRAAERATDVVEANTTRRPGDGDLFTKWMLPRLAWPRALRWACLAVLGRDVAAETEASFDASDARAVFHDRRLTVVLGQIRHLPAVPARTDWLRELELPIFGVDDGPSDANRAS